jgi:hypothetical protein
MQNDTTVQKQIEQYEAQMPPEIMNLIKSFDWKKELRMIVNQNQLLLDVAADLEESVYLMVLGVVEIGDVFERLIDVHNLPEDKVQKILTEVERQIFGPMHQKLLEVSSEQPGSEQGVESREAVLAEIEKEPQPVVRPSIQAITPTPIIPQQVSGPSEPFSLNLDEEVIPIKDEEIKPTIVSVDNIIDTTSIDSQTPIILNPTSMTETKNPIELNLTQPTAVSAPTKNYVADPYREPIE